MLEDQIKHYYGSASATFPVVGARRVFAAFDIIGELTGECGLDASQAVPWMRLKCVHAV